MKFTLLHLRESRPTEMDLVSIKFAAYCGVWRSEVRNVLLMKRMTAAVPESRRFLER